MLSLEKVSKNFGGLAALSDVSFEVNAGEIVGVIGVALDQFGHRRIFVLDVRFARGSPGTIGFVATPENIE